MTFDDISILVLLAIAAAVFGFTVAVFYFSTKDISSKRYDRNG